MKKNVLTILFIFVIFLTPSLLKANGESDASPQTSIGINPAIVEIVLKPNEITKQEITVFNLTNTAIPIKTTKESFNLSETNDIPSDKLDIYDAASWITISMDDTDFILKPGETRIVTLNIKEPENSSPGGHYATVYFQGLNPADLLTNSSANISIKLGVLVLIQAPGEIVDEIKVQNFSSSSISNTSQLTFNLSLLNTGNVHLLPSGKINFYNDLTNELIKSVDLDNKLILPGLINTYTYNIDPGYQIGKVSAQAVIKYGAENKVLESEKRVVLIFPFIYLILIIVLILFIIIFRKRIVKAIKILFNSRTNNPTAINIEDRSL